MDSWVLKSPHYLRDVNDEVNHIFFFFGCLQGVVSTSRPGIKPTPRQWKKDSIIGPLEGLLAIAYKTGGFQLFLNIRVCSEPDCQGLEIAKIPAPTSCATSGKQSTFWLNFLILKMGVTPCPLHKVTNKWVNVKGLIPSACNNERF